MSYGIFAANIHRRHLTKGQRAMAVAMIYPKAHPGKKTSSVSEEAKVSAVYLSQARTVLEYTLDFPVNVRSPRRWKAKTPYEPPYSATSPSRLLHREAHHARP